MISNKKVMIFLVLLIVAMICTPISAHTETADDITTEIAEYSLELISLSKSIHDETEKIADDESLDQDLRDLAEDIHVCSHDLESIAKSINKNVLELQTLIASSLDNNAESADAISEIKEHCEEFNTILTTKHEAIHDLVFNAPESHEEYADATHDAAHEAGDVADDIVEHIDKLAPMLSETTTTETATTHAACVSSADVSAKVAEIAEHSDELFTSAESILLDTKAIVKDETVDQNIRDLAKTIHLVSHELEDIAAGLQEDSARVQTLAAQPVANKAAIETLIAEMETATADYLTKLEGQHENIHELTYVAPKSREENADSVHDTAHTAEGIVEHLNEHLEALSAALNAPAELATTAPATSEATKSPGFGFFAAVCAVFGSIAYLVIRK